MQRRLGWMVEFRRVRHSFAFDSTPRRPGLRSGQNAGSGARTRRGHGWNMPTKTIEKPQEAYPIKVTSLSTNPPI